VIIFFTLKRKFLERLFLVVWGYSHRYFSQWLQDTHVPTIFYFLDLCVCFITCDGITTNLFIVSFLTCLVRLFVFPLHTHGCLFIYMVRRLLECELQHAKQLKTKLDGESLFVVHHSYRRSKDAPVPAKKTRFAIKDIRWFQLAARQRLTTDLRCSGKVSRIGTSIHRQCHLDLTSRRSSSITSYPFC
jgi:hypothetical protein